MMPLRVNGIVWTVVPGVNRAYRSGVNGLLQVEWGGGGGVYKRASRRGWRSERHGSVRGLQTH
jgi:hypothetical protein